MRRGRLYVFKGDGSYLVDIAGTRVKITRRKAGDIHWSTRGAIDRTGQPSSTMRRRPSGSESGTDGRWRTATEPAKEQRTEQSGFSWTEQEDRMSHGITMTAARRRVVAAHRERYRSHRKDRDAGW